MNAAYEAGFRFIDVANSGHHLLVEQHVSYFLFGLGSQAQYGLIFIERRIEHVWPGS